MKIVEDIRNAETIDEAVAIYKRATEPRGSTKPPDREEVLQFAREYADKYNEDQYWVLQQAENAFEFYEMNKEILKARTWKDGQGNTVKNWKLKMVNNWFKQR